MFTNKKDCPYCGEVIQAVATKCKHCFSEITNGNIDLKNINKENFFTQFLLTKEIIILLLIPLLLLAFETLINHIPEGNITSTIEQIFNGIWIILCVSFLNGFLCFCDAKFLEKHNIRIRFAGFMGFIFPPIYLIVRGIKLNKQKNIGTVKSHALLFLWILSILTLNVFYTETAEKTTVKTTEKVKIQEFIIGDVVENDSFYYKVNKIQFSNRLVNQFMSHDAGQGNKFLVIDVYIKNVDIESRIISAGEVRASNNGKWLKFENPEIIFSADYIGFENLNPLTSVTGKIVFKVPADLEGPFYWIPPRSNNRIKLLTQ